MAPFLWPTVHKQSISDLFNNELILEASGQRFPI